MKKILKVLFSILFVFLFVSVFSFVGCGKQENKRTMTAEEARQDFMLVKQCCESNKDGLISALTRFFNKDYTVTQRSSFSLCEYEWFDNDDEEILKFEIIEEDWPNDGQSYLYIEQNFGFDKDLGSWNIKHYARITCQFDEENHPVVTVAMVSYGENGSYSFGEEYEFTEEFARTNKILTIDMIELADGCLGDAGFILIDGYLFNVETAEATKISEVGEDIHHAYFYKNYYYFLSEQPFAKFYPRYDIQTEVYGKNGNFYFDPKAYNGGESESNQIFWEYESYV